MGKKDNSIGQAEKLTMEELMKLSQEELAQKVIDQQAAISEATNEFVAAIEDLKAENEALKKGKSISKDVVITFKKKSYKVTTPKVRVGKAIINAPELEEHPDAIASILEIEGQTTLQEVN